MNSKIFCSIVLTLMILFPFSSLTQWTQQNSGTEKFLNSIYFIDTYIGFAAGTDNKAPWNCVILKTTNGGESWFSCLNDTTFFIPHNIKFINDKTGFLSGGFYASQSPIIFRTTDAGTAWEKINNIVATGGIFSVDFININIGYASTHNILLKTTNAGINWFIVSGFSTFSRKGVIDFVNEKIGFFIRDSGKVYKTINGGINWAMIKFNSENELNDIKFINESTGIIVGTNGLILKTTNSGSNWIRYDNNNRNNLNSICIPEYSSFYVCGDSGIILKTTNTGQSWFTTRRSSEDTLKSIFFINHSTGYAAGSKGKILKTTTGGVIGINPVSTEIPKDYSLLQNYPNPFNPVTNIKFSIPKSAFVKLAVYDMLGREVESLISQQLSPGTYVVDWNAAKFSSGIYMYKLITNDFSLVKKMSLVK